MTQNQIVNLTQEHIKKIFEGEASGHDWWHIYRVWKTAVHLARQEGPVDLFVVELAALLHDIGDWKFHQGNTEIGPQLAKKWLIQHRVAETTITHICQIISEISFKGAGVSTPMTSKEGQIVQDADRLDAIGAIGIARTFAYGGHKGREMYNPNMPAEHHETFEQYQQKSGPSINHFYEKLLLLKDLLNTKTAQKMAQERHAFMEQFLDHFFKEWEGEI